MTYQRSADPRVHRLWQSLRDHCWLPIVARQAELSEREALSLLEQMARDGLAERYTGELWGRA